MSTDRIARLMGAGFGLVFVQVGAFALPTAVAVPLRVVSVVAFLALIGAGKWWGGREAPLDRSEGGPKTSLGPNYQFLVGSEGAAASLGIMVVNRLLHTPAATVPWIATVVGAHFFVLAVLWHRPSLHVLGGAITACGVTGLALAFGGAPEAAVATAAGIGPGMLLIGSVWWSSVPPQRGSAAGRTTI
ncbi:hypothetical protein [Kitasatospora sp. SUK 42]|uniref:hypothetical protein n=1 Tax=Kitasatospora sp. SUK 42 TaxID=1588882 RepID=UPI0020C83421|nr:hypothetical protein [Kitasatospora sp. SUK 42]